MRPHNYYVYMLTNVSNKVLYTGVTNDLIRRVYEHENSLYPGFTQKYNVKKLIYFEHYEDVDQAITREKQIKGWTRAKKDALIQTTNPGWAALNTSIKE